MLVRWCPWLAVLALAACATPPPPAPVQACAQEGMASWYGPQPGHKRTADGEHLDPTALTAAHRTLPFGSRVTVTNLATGRSVTVRITDRGPVVRGRIIDLSPAAAKQLEMRSEGVARVRLEMLPEAAVASAGPTCPLRHPEAS